MNRMWYIDYARGTVRQIYKKVTNKQLISSKYSGSIVLPPDDGNNLLASKIESGMPFMAARYGYNELETMAAVYCYVEQGSTRFLDKVIEKDAIFNNAGFFPRDKDLLVDFGKIMMDSTRSMDLVGVWYIPYEEYFLRTMAENVQMMVLKSFEPWNSQNPWTKALKGKKVLVIHPFEQTIKEQYLKRDYLFENKSILPEFTLITYPAVQTIAGTVDERFNNWFEALDMMTKDISLIDFDIAIIGCGAYGFPLAKRIKDMGKQAVHMGGATQLLFGIKGGRWDNHPVVSSLYNDYWVRPGKKEIPQDSKSIENNCYW